MIFFLQLTVLNATLIFALLINNKTNKKESGTRKKNKYTKLNWSWGILIFILAAEGWEMCNFVVMSEHVY